MKEIRTISQLLNVLKKGSITKNRNNVMEPLPSKVKKQDMDKRSFCVSLAEHSIEIESLYSEVYYLCRDYICDKKPEIKITINDSDIEYEYSVAENKSTSNSSSYMETLAVYRKISEAMLQYDTFLAHGAVIAVDNKGYMFTAKSGTGKTTHIQKWLTRLENAYVVNGDKPLIKITDTEAFACGTPWCGKERMGKNIMVPLKAVVFMERGEENTINEISFNDAFGKLIQQTYRPNETELVKKTISILSKLSGKVKFYQYYFNNMKEDAFDISYEALTGNNA